MSKIYCLQEERPQPYIGISGVANQEQHERLFKIAISEKFNTIDYFLMIGVQATTKTQLLEIENKMGQMWHPVGQTIRDAAFEDESGFTKPFIHCFFEGREDLGAGLAVVMKRTQNYSKGVQLNGLHWLDEDYSQFLNKFRDAYPNQDIILQANHRIMESSPQEIVRALGRLPVNYVLFDRSGGRGINLVSEYIRPYIDEVYQSQLNIGVSLAGGLEASNVEELIGPLFSEFPKLSCDAEGKLRCGQEHKTILDLNACNAFIRVCKDMVHSASKKPT